MMVGKTLEKPHSWVPYIQNPKARQKVNSCLMLSQEPEIKHLVKVNSPLSANKCEQPTNAHMRNLTRRGLKS